MGGYRFHQVNGTLYVVLRGMVGVEAMRSVCAAITARVDDGRVDRVLMDLRAAVLTIGQANWHAMQTDPQGCCQIETRLGFLVCEPQYEEVWGHCLKMVAQGFTRLLFHSPARAASWASLPLQTLDRTSPTPPAKPAACDRGSPQH
jgi:hypothetical protein